jgi:DNA-binding response OmpR family regulator
MSPKLAGCASQANQKRRTVLVVDRDDAICHLCSYLIIQDGMSAFSCWEPDNAITILSNVDVDLVVTDIEFPARSGIDLTHHIRTNYPNTQVLVMTPFGDVGSAVKAIRHGATDYMTKPFSPEQFQEKLSAWCEGRGAFSKWARSERDGLPEERTFTPSSEIRSRIQQERLTHNVSLVRRAGGRPSRYAAIVADAVRTLRQIIRRDIQETALFAGIEEEKLRTAYLMGVYKEESCFVCSAGSDAQEETTETPGEDWDSNSFTERLPK